MRKFLLAAFIISIAACTKEITSDSLPVNANSQTNAIVRKNSYLPLTKGTSWSYKVSTETSSKNSKLTVLGVHRQFNGRNYTAVKSLTKKKLDTVYYNQTQHDYYLYTNTATDDASKVDVELLFLKDDASVGTTWTESAGSANGNTLNCYGEIKERDISLTVGDTTYTSVIHSYIEIRKPVFTFYIVVSKQDIYSAKNVGIIKNVLTQVLPESSTSTTEITGYTIK